MYFITALTALGGLASLAVASSPAVLAPLAQSPNGFATSLNPQLTTLPMHKRDLPVGTCNAQTPCANGACCGKDNLCGYSPKSCGDGCQHNCDAKAQCGPYAPSDSQKCPLNVCCSEFGYCGSTPDFCTWTNKDDSNYPSCDTKYGGCGDVKRPSCSGNSVGKRTVGYYESWANTRKCQAVAPEDLALDGYTSINFAFAFFDPKSLQITPMDSNGASLYSRFTALKSKKPGLQAWISVGGWSFTDPGPTQTAFSDMAGNAGSRKQFIDSLISFMDTYGFDGVDLDWEYPGADDRGGKKGDAANYVTLCKEMKAAFGSKYGVTMTLPTSYWYLQNFDLLGVQDSVDWFNLMAYDLHGVWDSQSKFVGPYIAPHTNITEIDAALDLLWRTGVDPSKVVMGQGFYGRSFTLADSNCNTPNGVCQFSGGINGGANPGPCSNARGILDYQEIEDIITKNNLQPVHDEKAGVKWITWDSDQWVSYDDKDTFKQKVDFANSRCLGGMMVWAMDQVDQTKDNGFGAAPAAPGTPKGDAAQAQANNVAGMTCYTSNCGEDCKPGTKEVAQFNGQPGQLSTNDRCPKKKYRSLCCDESTNIGTCQWRGYKGAGVSCMGGCAEGETELTRNTNSHQAKKGDQNCHGGLMSYCCSDFKPSPGADLKKDMEDAAKAAAEAAAAQAALDIAAKAFCRIAVPALLAPLEALEDLIPIVGEILDVAEIAATPAIIEACTKGIEKTGKAEFKVFGKTKSLTMDKPTVKPSDIPDRPPPPKDDPPKNGDKDDGKDGGKSCKKKNTKRGGDPGKDDKCDDDDDTATVYMSIYNTYDDRDPNHWAIYIDDPKGKPSIQQLVDPEQKEYVVENIIWKLPQKASMFRENVRYGTIKGGSAKIDEARALMQKAPVDNESKTWNCQDWALGALHSAAAAGLIEVDPAGEAKLEGFKQNWQR